MPKKFGPAGDCRHLKVGTLKVKQPGWCLNFSAQFIKKTLFEQMKIKL
jgi:hypothetical protein